MGMGIADGDGIAEGCKLRARRALVTIRDRIRRRKATRRDATRYDTMLPGDVQYFRDTM